MLIVLFSEKQPEWKDDWEEERKKPRGRCCTLFHIDGNLNLLRKWSCSLEVMTLFILTKLEGSNETTWLIEIPDSLANWEISFSRFKTAVVSSLPDHTLSHTFLFSLLVYFSLIFWLPLNLSPPHCCCLPCLASHFSLPHSLIFLWLPSPTCSLALQFCKIFFFFFWDEVWGVAAVESWSVAHVCLTRIVTGFLRVCMCMADFRQCSEKERLSLAWCVLASKTGINKSVPTAELQIILKIETQNEICFDLI